MALMAASDPQIIQIDCHIRDKFGVFPGLRNDESTIVRGSKSDCFTCRCLERFLTGGAAISLPIPFNLGVFIAACQTSSSEDSWSSKLDAIILGGIIFEILLDKIVIFTVFRASFNWDPQMEFLIYLMLHWLDLSFFYRMLSLLLHSVIQVVDLLLTQIRD